MDEKDNRPKDKKRKSIFYKRLILEVVHHDMSNTDNLTASYGVGFGSSFWNTGKEKMSKKC